MLQKPAILFNCSDLLVHLLKKNPYSDGKHGLYDTTYDIRCHFNGLK